MLVNNIDIANFKSILLKKTIQTSEIIIYDDWLRQAITPLYIGKQEKYKQVKLQLLIEDIDDENCLNDISNLVKQFEKCVIKFEDLSFYYDCVIVNKNHERKTSSFYLLDVELKGFAYKSELIEVANRILSKTINVPGNLEIPAIIEITTSIDMIDIAITGLGEPFIISNLLAGQKVIVNGEDCTVTENGVNKFADFDGWGFPRLIPGSNVITFDKVSTDINIKYKPRWI